MNQRWTVQQVAGLAPDAASLKAGEKLSQLKQWQTLGQHEQVVWGEIKGSGAKPYQTCIALEEPAFKCSCPSRKFPCKHGLGLALAFANGADMAVVAPPEWVQEWLEKRQQRVKKQSDKTAAQQAPVDEATLQKRVAAQQKRSLAREEKVDAGVLALQRWLWDFIRQGLADSSKADWAQMAKRLMDAQAPGLARRLLHAEALRYEAEHWQIKQLAALARLHTLLIAWQRRDSLSPALHAELQAQLGFTTTKEDLLLLEVEVQDQWVVLGQHQQEENNLRTQWTWLWGVQTQRYALLLDFAVASQPMTLRPSVGQVVAAECIYYPAAVPLRAWPKQEILTVVSASSSSDANLALPTLPYEPIALALAQYQAALSQNPWLERYPLALDQVVLVLSESRWYCVDTDQHQLALKLSFDQAVSLQAVSGGHPLQVFGEWLTEQAYFKPLAALSAGQVVWTISQTILLSE